MISQRENDHESSLLLEVDCLSIVDSNASVDGPRFAGFL